MIASVNPLASAAGLTVLREGGNGVDAAIAAGAVLTVTEPWAGQLGGDGFMLVRTAEDGRVTAINGSGAAPAAATIDRYTSLGGIPRSGWLAATVPGLVHAWGVALERFGSMSMARLLEDAVNLAEDGFPLTARQAKANAEMAPIGGAFAETAAVFYPQGQAPPAGFLLRQHNLGRTLRTLQREGPSAFYQGQIARAILKASSAAGGLFTEHDFAGHRTEVLDPVQTSYRGWTVIEQPPVSQGLIVLMALNLLECSELPTEPVARVHHQVEAHKLALAERLRRLGDPAVTSVDLDPLLSKTRAKALAAEIDPRRARGLAPLPAGHPDTTYLCVVDEARNVVSYIHSLYGGNGVVAGDTGVLLNDRMCCFSLDRNSPNRLEASKRPIHTLNGWMLQRDGEPLTVGGTPGSFWQVQTNLQVISALIDGGLPLQAALDAPRWRMGPERSWTDASLELEGRFGQPTADALRRLGHQVHLIGDWAAGGAAQAISIDSSSLIGAGDPRPGTSAVLGY
jgi:gamma-glutamyltranspeptidase/glutathione hydrolase